MHCPIHNVSTQEKNYHLKTSLDLAVCETELQTW